MVAVALIVPGTFATQPPPPLRASAPPPAATRVVTDSFATAPHCDQPAPTTVAGKGVLLVGNSIALEIQACFSRILATRGYRVLDAVEVGASFCDSLPELRQRVRAGERPPIVVIYSLLAPLSPGGARQGRDDATLTDTWIRDLHDVVTLYADVGSRIFLVPPPLSPDETGEDPLAPRLREIAALRPDRVAVLDAHRFIRDPAGTYQWRMPCLVGEPGCSEGSVPVRSLADALHLCARTAIESTKCGPERSGGGRRVASGLAVELLAKLDARQVR